MKFSKIIPYLALILLWTAMESCTSRRALVRIRTAGKNRNQNIQALKDSTQNKPPVDTINREVKQLKYEQFVFLANLITSNLVKAQKVVYEKRYAEAEGLVKQTISWHPTSDAYMLLGSIYKLQGKFSSGDSCWSIAQKLDPEFEKRISISSRDQANLN
jgi:hypothetical protein